MNKFAAFQCFVAVCEQGSFTSAAKKLNTSASTVTKTISRLEDELRVRLFNRTTRQLALTEPGQELFDRVKKILVDLSDAESAMRVASKTVQGTVRLVVPNLFGRLTLIPALREFFERYPDVQLQIHFSDRHVDLIEQGYDLGVHTGELADTSFIRRQLTRGPMITAASPIYLEKYGTPQKPEDLLHHNCIHGRFGLDWTFKNEQSGRQRIRVSGNLAVYNGDALREAAVMGMGIVHSSWWALRHDLMAGRLIPVLEPYQVAGHAVSVIFPAGRHLPARVRVLIDFLIEITASGGDKTAP
ncbi:LysR family transcriptional regulator (plasmid) [Paracoccus methylovorus]|uniref:LysR family transcriptional regulator n=1 Tax=Paracoccus methylovorus TaxID=2812658 RepID=A0ABX7JQ73_9RHOB|nr:MULTISPECIES: LysR family transcriptional regulator [Paracoccus]QRZ16131.1 LysR family transcriptional regulator [Paracoccus methylovorus]